MTTLIFLSIPIALLVLARFYASKHSNTAITTAEALVRWLYHLAWFMTALAEGAGRALVHYRELRWAIKEQPVCEAYRPWEELPRQVEPSKSLVAQLKVWEA